ncbi:uncharacterized protein STEHIDRAFT_166618 [Stereum hirsutum FP-91666 SS1]|uniref:uncharacterized protein n=1 Tax=Stereum hirsutum (strain FP-91666) TaxID=721885 RepID=UPI000440E30E|nr:uncharacterized protein STEHIDRAFT_166618 [Stereum hirsutum FP-91666 SS1]EIM90436.1 hypothetical protein STEHIDRAFT_166618 [Stereum hirsutum FP-91666 SS1]
MSQHGDDLEDDFVPDDTVALSDDGDAASIVGDPDDIANLLSADEDEDEGAEEQQKQQASAEKKRKRREKEKERKLKKRKLAEESGTANDRSSSPSSSSLIAAQPPHRIAEYLASMQAKSFPKMSALELQDRQIPGRELNSGYDLMEGIEDFGRLGPVYSTKYATPSPTHPTPFISPVPTLHTRLSQRTKSPGSPTLLVLTSAALRTADMTRALKSTVSRASLPLPSDKSAPTGIEKSAPTGIDKSAPTGIDKSAPTGIEKSTPTGKSDEKKGEASIRLFTEKSGEVAKLFAKHFKLDEHVRYLSKTKVGAAVGTPGRVGKLLCETDSLKTTALTHIILDTTHIDTKKRSLLDIPETRDEVFRTVLGAPSVREGIREGRISVVLF